MAGGLVIGQASDVTILLAGNLSTSPYFSGVQHKGCLGVQGNIIRQELKSEDLPHPPASPLRFTLILKVRLNVPHTLRLFTSLPLGSRNLYYYAGLILDIVRLFKNTLIYFRLCWVLLLSRLFSCCGGWASPFGGSSGCIWS